MKKWIVGFAALLTLLCLASCGKEETPSASWLEGKWYSAEWDATYTISEKDDKWAITFEYEGKQETVVEKAMLSIEKKIFTLTDARGTTYVIEKKSDDKMDYQQIAVEGVTGTTAQTTFTKVK